ncbi:MAG: hypothetical protein ACRDNT_30380, partial [Streptosporangiaceae bacterium]
MGGVINVTIRPGVAVARQAVLQRQPVDGADRPGLVPLCFGVGGLQQSGGRWPLEARAVHELDQLPLQVR